MNKINDLNYLRLLNWFSPNFPIGSYIFSHGLENAVEEQIVIDQISLLEWIKGVITFGTLRFDTTIFRASFTAKKNNDENFFKEINKISFAYRSSKEIALESVAQGRAFLNSILSVWENREFKEWVLNFKKEGYNPDYTVVLGVTACIFKYL